MRTLPSQPGIMGLLIGFAGGFLMYASEQTAGITVILLMGAGVLLGAANRHWVIEVFSLLPAMTAGSLFALTTVVWKRDPTAHNLWPFELLMLAAMAGAFLLLLGGAGVLLRRRVLHASPEPRPPASISQWVVPIAAIAGIVGYVLVRGAMMDVR